MHLRTQALVVDFSLAAGALALGAVVAGPAVTLAVLGLGSLGCLLSVGALYLLEQEAPLELTAEYRFSAVGISFAVTLAGWAGLVLWGLADAPAGAVLVGAGLGLAVYRAVFGLFGSLPDQRLAQAELLAGEDERVRRPPQQ